MVCPVQEHSKNYSAKATILAGVLNMWRRHYGEVLFGSMMVKHIRGGEWYLEKRGSRKILARSRNLGNVFDKSRSLVFSWFVFTFFEYRNFSPKSLGLGFLTRISASRRVSDFTIRHPSYRRTV